MSSTIRLTGLAAIVAIVVGTWSVLPEDFFCVPVFGPCGEARVTEPMRAIHMGGNWGLNTNAVLDPPPQYFQWLESLKVNWVGISVALHIEDSMDSTVERKYADVQIPTFTDDALRNVIRKFKGYGFNVYLTLAFESVEAYENNENPVERHQLGSPRVPNSDPEDPALGCDLVPNFWPWCINHREHSSFVDEFWRTYTKQAVHFATIAQQEGVGLYSLGTETENLFRVRSGGEHFPNHFGRELRKLVDAVRAVYDGLLSYDMHYSALTYRDFWGPATDALWHDLELDVVGISAYFELAGTAPMSVLSTAVLRRRWDQIFSLHLNPLQQRNAGKPIAFLEFGYTDSIASVNRPNANEFQTRQFTDNNNNGLDDGEEQQNNSYAAFFEANQDSGYLVKGAFLWGNDMSGDQEWAQVYSNKITFSIRQKLVERTVRDRYRNIAN